MMYNLTDVSVLKEILARAGVAPKRSAGQNFLISPEVVEAALTALEGKSLYVTELGSGLGTLTQALACGGYTVRGIEKDDVFVRLLLKHIPLPYRSKVEIIHDDLKNVSWEFPSHEEYQVLGSIPYNLSGLIIRRITQLEPAPQCAVLIVQNEVGERLAAAPPNMSLLSLAVGLWGSAQRLLSIPPHCFWPQPKVSSVLVMLEPNASSGDIQEREAVLAFAKPFFQNKRKQIGGVLHRAYDVDQDAVASLLEQAGIQETSRPQELSVKQWRSFYALFSFHG